MKMKIFVVCVVTGLLVLACGCIEEEKEEVKLLQNHFYAEDFIY